MLNIILNIFKNFTIHFLKNRVNYYSSFDKSINYIILTKMIILNIFKNFTIHFLKNRVNYYSSFDKSINYIILTKMIDWLYYFDKFDIYGLSYFDKINMEW